MAQHFPFYQIGFRSNPFRVLTDEEWIEIAVIPPALEQAMLTTSSHLQLLGATGHGKSTTLLALHSRLRTLGQAIALEYVPHGQHTVKTDYRALSIFIVDEAQRLWPWEWLRLLRWARGTQKRLIISSHVDMRWVFRAMGLQLQSLTLDYSVCLAEILQRRLAYFALEDPCPINFAPDAVTYLETRYGANLRAIQYFLYEVFQRFPPRGLLSGDDLRQVVTDLQAIK